MTGTVRGADGIERCPWGDAPDDMRRYHDEEWGRPLRGDRAIFERLSLEGFQSGLSWLTILRKREAFRAAFDGFDIEAIAAYDESDVDRLLADAGIVRHRGKIEAVTSNARVLRDWQHAEGEGVLDARVRACALPGRARPATLADVPTTSLEATTLSRDLKRRGWRFLGPTTAYAALQAIGVVDDHVAGCHVAEHPALG